MTRALSKRFPYRLLKWMAYNYLRFEKWTERRFRALLLNILVERQFRDADKVSVDVGCGIRGKGTINLDPYIEKNIHRRMDEIDPRKYRNFIIADAQSLPLRKASVHFSRMNFVLEHLENPVKAIQEQARVVREQSLIKVPTHNTPDNTNSHLYTWSPFTFKNILKKGFRKVKVIIIYDELIGVCVK